MNFLAHSLISLEIDKKKNKETLYGNFAGDYYKGIVEKIKLPENLKEGIVLHRKIDKISDRNDNFLNEFLNKNFGIFKGVVSDMYIDHFLSKNFEKIFNENIVDVERKIIEDVKKYKVYFPNDFESFFNWLDREKVLIKYANLEFLDRVFLGISGRVKRGEILKKAVLELKKNYESIENTALEEFFFVKEKIFENF